VIQVPPATTDTELLSILRAFVEKIVEPTDPAPPAPIHLQFQFEGEKKPRFAVARKNADGSTTVEYLPDADTGE
jgi:hypothetical protein